MLIIFEGPDGGGKTTLIERFSPLLNVPVTVENHGPYLGEKRIAHNYAQSVYHALNGAPTIMDRSWLSESIYGIAIRGDVSRLRSWEAQALERAAMEAGAVLVLCLPPYEACQNAWASRLEGEYIKREPQLRAVYRGYEAAKENWERHLTFPMVTWDYTKDNVEATMKRIASIAHVRLFANDYIAPTPPQQSEGGGEEEEPSSEKTNEDNEDNGEKLEEEEETMSEEELLRIAEREQAARQPLGLSKKKGGKR